MFIKDAIYCEPVETHAMYTTRVNVIYTEIMTVSEVYQFQYTTTPVQKDTGEGCHGWTQGIYGYPLLNFAVNLKLP
jgi:hypothetical protein